MKKIPTLFEREFENHRIVRILPNISPDLAWVMAGDGVATIKWDGACCAVINGVFYNRVTDSSGQAKLNINLQAGQYIITSSYNGANIANTVTVSA